MEMPGPRKEVKNRAVSLPNITRLASSPHVPLPPTRNSVPRLGRLVPATRYRILLREKVSGLVHIPSEQGSESVIRNIYMHM